MDDFEWHVATNKPNITIRIPCQFFMFRLVLFSLIENPFGGNDMQWALVVAKAELFIRENTAVHRVFKVFTLATFSLLFTNGLP